MKQYIIVIDNEKNSNPLQNPEYGFLDDMALDYFETMSIIEEKLKNYFQNSCIKLAINSFLINTTLETIEIISLISVNKIDVQCYITQVEDFNFATTSTKELEIDYLKSKLKS